MKAPNVYVVIGGNALWLDGQTPGTLGVLMSCPIMAASGAPAFEDACEVETMDPVNVGMLKLALMGLGAVELE